MGLKQYLPSKYSEARLSAPYVSIFLSKGALKFSSGCTKQFPQLKGPGSLHIFYDDKLKQMGIEANEGQFRKDDVEAMKITTAQTVCIKGFLKHFKIELKMDLRYAIEKENDRALFIINLSKPLGETRKNNMKGGSQSQSVANKR